MSYAGSRFPLAYDLHYYRGDTYRRTVRISDINEDGTQGEPKDLTGCTVLAQVREYYDGKVLSVINTTINPDQVEFTGYLDLELDTHMTDLEGQVGIWDLQITWPSGDVYTYLKGNVTCKLDVSYNE